jgi:hypothetical protein
MRRRRLNVCLAAATLALFTTGAGQAARPHEVPPSPTGGSDPATTRAESGRKLPFSGIDLALLTAGAGPLLLIGVSLRRRQAASKVKAAREDSLTLA